MLKLSFGGVRNARVGAVNKLVNEYPANGIVIDQNEARDFFKNIRGFDKEEAAILIESITF
jgi:hypothetical protein